MSKDVFERVLPKRIRTNKTGVFYKEIERTTIDNTGKITKKIIDDKVYVIRYTDENKKERFVTMGRYSEGIRESYCVNKRAEFITIAKNGELPPQIQRRKRSEVITLDKLAKTYFEDKADTRSTKKQKGVYENYLKQRFGNKDLTLLSKQDFNKLKSDLDAMGLAKRTVNGVISLAKAIINYSIKEYDLLINNPLNGVKNHNVKTIRRERYLTLEEVKQLVDTVRQEEDEDLYHFVMLALNTGGRVNTILDIQKKDISFTDGHITLNDFKNESTYTGFIGDENYLDELRKKCEPENKKDRVIKMPERTLQRKLKKILDKLFNDGLDKRDFKDRVVPHTLRHTFASQLVLAGVPIYTVQKLMNHSDIAMTSRYAKLSKDAGAKAVKGLYDVN